MKNIKNTLQDNKKLIGVAALVALAATGALYIWNKDGRSFKEFFITPFTNLAKSAGIVSWKEMTLILLSAAFIVTAIAAYMQYTAKNQAIAEYKPAYDAKEAFVNAQTKYANAANTLEKAEAAVNTANASTEADTAKKAAAVKIATDAFTAADTAFNTAKDELAKALVTFAPKCSANITLDGHKVDAALLDNKGKAIPSSIVSLVCTAPVVAPAAEATKQ